MDKALFTAQASILEIPNDGAGKGVNPFLTVARFIFADDGGNENNQGIEVEDFDEVAESAINMPVKMNFSGTRVENHLGSYVVGHITEMKKSTAESGANQLEATAVLYKDEYPEEVTYLRESFASGEAPGVSYEIAYEDSVIKDGIQWIKKLVTCAATFVRTPAYGKRTALLALASAKTDSEFNDTLISLAAQAEEIENPTPSNEGGNNVDELEKAKAELDTVKAEAETKTAEVARLIEELNARDETISTLNDNIATAERERTLESRIRKMSEAGFSLEADAEKATKKKEFLVSFSDEAFDEYVSDLVAAKSMAAKTEPTNRTDASVRTQVPRLEIPELDSVPSFNFRD